MTDPLLQRSTATALLLIASAMAPVLAQDEPAAMTPSEESETLLSSDQDPWRISLTPMVWAIGLNGDVGVGPVGASVDASFLDLLDESDSVFGFTGRLEVAHGRLGGFVDGAYAKLGVDNATGPAGLSRIDVTSELAVLDFGVMYRVAEWTPEEGARDNALPGSLDAYVGGRLMHVGLELDPAMLPGISADMTWVDPIVGGRLILPLSKSVHVLGMGDVGGFGASSDLTWSATAALGWNTTLWGHPASLRAGYRAIGHDYTNGSGARRFTWDVIMHGPIFGLSVQF